MMSSALAQKFSMSSIKSLEPFADECTRIFIDAMRDLEGQPIDLGAWLQWYAFDVIEAITFQRRFGSMEKREDVQGMIGGLEAGLRYGGVAGQIPWLHSWTLEDPWVGKFLAALPFHIVPNPLRTMVQASAPSLYEGHKSNLIQITQDCIDDYDRQSAQQHNDRPDFLAWLRSEEIKGKPMSNRDIRNHLSNNLLVQKILRVNLKIVDT
jgi:cytochrome P450